MPDVSADGSIDSAAKRKGSLCQQVANSEGNKKTRYSGLDLPEVCHQKPTMEDSK